jgi:hypothetical protein
MGHSVSLTEPALIAMGAFLTMNPGVHRQQGSCCSKRRRACPCRWRPAGDWKVRRDCSGVEVREVARTRADLQLRDTDLVASRGGWPSIK